MQCSKCSAEMVESQHFCEECGTAVQAATSAPTPVEPSLCKCAAGSSTSDVDGFCTNCGFRITLQPPPPRELQFDFPPDLGLVSNVGSHHVVNQDSGATGRSASGAVGIVVADGVSSSFNADVASATAAVTAYQELVNAADAAADDTEDDISAEDIVRRAISVAHAAVMEIPYANPRMEEPEATIALAFVRGNAVTIGWVGDSRAYTIRGAQSRLITRDDSWLADVVESGLMTVEAAQADRRSHSITQCLGMRDDPIRINIRNIILEPDTWLIVCTDGLWNYFDKPAAMAELISEAGPDIDAFELCQYLVKHANTAGGHDNITVAAYRLGNTKTALN